MSKDSQSNYDEPNDGRAERPQRVSSASLRLESFLSERLYRLQPRGKDGKPPKDGDADDGKPFDWRERMQAYRKRQRAQLAAEMEGDRNRDTGEKREDSASGPVAQRIVAPPFSGISALNRWIPIGPSAARQGQAANFPTVSGRVSSIAVAPGGERVYVGAANGGVWRSEDKGRSWRSLMDAFDLNPQNQFSDSLACGALAVVAGNDADSDIIYVGTGEAIGLTAAGVGTGPYFGVGPVVSTDGGQNWVTERAVSNSPSLAGTGFYELAVDPNDSTHVLAATPLGLYRRVPAQLFPNQFRWRRVRLTTNTSPNADIPAVTSVVAGVGANGQTIFCAVNDRGGIFRSSNGNTWDTLVGDGNTGASRYLLAMRANAPQYLYVVTGGSSVYTVNRIDLAGPDFTPRSVTGFSGDFANGSLTWGRAIAVKPDDENCLFLGGMLEFANAQGNIVDTDEDGNWSGGLYRANISGTGQTISVTNTYIGGSTHPDIHALTFTPDNPNELWLGCDGGLFFTDRPLDDGMIFQARNNGLQTLMMHHIGQHPDEDAVLFCGTQDNGNLRYAGEEAWYVSAFGDCGYVVVNRADPYKVISTIQRDGRRNRIPFAVCDNGGVQGTHDRTFAWYQVDDSALFYFPLAGTTGPTPNSGEPDRLATGSRRLWISDDFGETWESVPNGDLSDMLPSEIRAITFHGANKIYVGTIGGEVYRYRVSGGSWLQERLDFDMQIGPMNTPIFTILPLVAPITDIAVDPAVASGDAIYVTLGGYGDYRHLWHFDGNDWHSCSGSLAFGFDTVLLDVQHNAVVVDEANPHILYVGADIGVWRSTDRGLTWAPYAYGLPDAAVIDLKLHPQRLLRASTHGRGVYERLVDENWVPGVELFVRDTQLDTGRRRTVNGRDNPIRLGEDVYHWQGKDIKIDIRDSAGNYQFGVGAVDFVTFEDALADENLGRQNRIDYVDEARLYVQVHNRGILPADNVRVMALITDTAAGMPSLPAGYDANIRNGTPINNADWQTIGIEQLDDVRVGFPQIAEFTITPDMMPAPMGRFAEQYAVVVFVNHSEDEYSSTRVVVDANTRRERKAGQKNSAILRFTYDGQLSRASWNPDLSGIPLTFQHGQPRPVRFGMQMDVNRYPGPLYLCLPERLLRDPIERVVSGAERVKSHDLLRAWFKAYADSVEGYQRRSRRPFHRDWTRRRLIALEKIVDSGVVLRVTADDVVKLTDLTLAAGDAMPAFLFVEPPNVKELNDERHAISVRYASATNGSLLGGVDILLNFFNAEAL